jgi:5'-3' exonuclease
MSYDDIILDGGWLAWRSAHIAVKNGEDPGELFLLACARAAASNGAKNLHVAWEGSRRGRRAIMETYKEGKGSESPQAEAARDLMVRGRKDVDEVLHLLGVSRYRAPDWESDDVVATLALRLSKSGRRVLILSGDKDMMQCVNPKAHLVRPLPNREKPMTACHRSWRECCADIVKDGEGFPPEPDFKTAWVSYQALNGDSADGIPGVRGIGPKGAAQAIRAYPDVLQRMVRGRSALSALPEKLIKLLTAPDALKQAVLSWRLAELRTDLEPELTKRDRPAAEDFIEDALQDLDWVEALSTFRDVLRLRPLG